MQPLTNKGNSNSILFKIWWLSTSYIQDVDNHKASILFFRTFVFLLFFPLWGLVHVSPLHGAERFPLNYISPEQDRIILMAESLVMERRYDEAMGLFDQMEKEEPESILPSMGRLLILMAHSLEKGETFERIEKEILAEMKKNTRLLKKMKDQPDLTAWDHYIMGGSLGAQGLYELEHQRYVSAFMHGISALSHFKEARIMDPEIHDVDFATGLYKYFRSVKTRYLWFLPLIHDQRLEGIEEIRTALGKGHYAVPACKIALIALAEKEGRDLEGIKMGEAFLKEGPKCLLIRDPLAKIYRRRSQWFDAGMTYYNGYDGDPSIRWVLLEAGRDFLMGNDLTEAETAFQAYLSGSPPDSGAAQAHLGLSRIYHRKGDPSLSQQERAWAVKLDPELRNSPIEN
ncbi:MAG: hypothetical protein CO150_09935 [Nitrospirae bacterium CG_4_9_14_3_um_filter_53_35]|nr:MAG: hypothetical protein COW52_08805 [Nitrospirae bacterium CG17_big_fil_post_rev_8_21_14_2_50_50_9]PJA72875.1 MAG: hypothetical protein CO150_09935 [Nitrospirae bacterium CG_4_9_14_3_um_filter_53_35]